MRRHFIAVTVPVLLAALAPWGWARAAELTRVATSAEEKDPFGMFLDFTYEYTRDRGTLTREWYQGGTTANVTELRYAFEEQRLGIDAHVGVYKDLELHLGLPIVFQQDRSWSFAKGTNADNSTIYRNCVEASGAVCASPGLGTGRLFEVSDGARSFRGGLGNFTAGVAWAPYVQAKDSTKPTWVLRFDYEAPTAALANPAARTRADARGGIGDRAHRYTFGTALSRRIGVAEPYFSLHYTLPWRGPGWYSNCDSRSVPSMGHPENCGASSGGFTWTRELTGLKPSHTGGFTVGTELVLYEKPQLPERLVVDLRGWVRYVSEGRVHNELSDVLGKLLTTSDYAQGGAQVALIGQAAEFIKLRAATSLSYDTDRFLTYESVGRDLDGNSAVDVSSNPVELNPTYDFRVDRVGRRFRMTEQFVFRVVVQATFVF